MKDNRVKFHLQFRDMPVHLAKIIDDLTKQSGKPRTTVIIDMLDELLIREDENIELAARVKELEKRNNELQPYKNILVQLKTLMDGSNVPKGKTKRLSDLLE